MARPSCVLLVTLALAPALGCSRREAEPNLATVTGAHAEDEDCTVERRCGRDVDLDGDGHAEHVTWYYDGGSGFGAWSMTVADAADGGPTAPPIELEVGGSFGRLVSVSTVEPLLAARPRLIDGLMALLPGSWERRASCDSRTTDGALDRPCLDPAFAWLVDVYRNGDLPPRGPFSARWRYRPRWVDGKPMPAPRQYLVLREPRDVLLSFAGLSQLAEPEPCGAWSARRAAHGVALVDAARGRWTWAYVTPDDVTKLRWPSIHRVACASGLVLIERTASERSGHDLVVVDPSQGRLGLVAGGVTAWSVDQARISLVDATGPRVLELVALQRSFE
jgi:hypothetical protein